MTDSVQADRRPAPEITRNAMLVMLAIGPYDRHGYAIMREVERITDGITKLGPGAVYTTVARLVEDGLIEESDDRPDPQFDDQRRRYYRLTATGKAAVGAEARRLESLVQAARPWALSVR